MIKKLMDFLKSLFDTSPKDDFDPRLGESKTKDKVNCQNWEDIQANPNRNAFIQGNFRKYTPVVQGKGRGRMYWAWEIVLRDGHSIPVEFRDQMLEVSHFEGKLVLIEGLIFYGVIIGDESGQHAKGYRIDADKIM